MLVALEQGFPQLEIESAAYQFQREIESGRRIVVGVNRFAMERDEGIPTFRLDPAIEQAQVLRLGALRSSRNGILVDQRLDALEAAAQGSCNLVPHILAAAEAYATVGEISGRLRSVFGEYREAK